MEKLAKRAATEALNSPLPYQLGSLVIKGGKTLAIGYNNGKKHAEVHALTQLTVKQAKGGDLIVVRVNKKGLAMSKPCKNCQATIMLYGIKRVYYTDSDGNIQKLMLR